MSTGIALVPALALTALIECPMPVSDVSWGCIYPPRIGWGRVGMWATRVATLSCTSAIHRIHGLWEARNQFMWHKVKCIRRVRLEYGDGKEEAKMWGQPRYLTTGGGHPKLGMLTLAQFRPRSDRECNLIHKTRLVLTQLYGSASFYLMFALC